MLLDLRGSERERVQALNPRGCICWGNTTLIEPRKAGLAWMMLSFTGLIKKTVNSREIFRCL